MDTHAAKLLLFRCAHKLFGLPTETVVEVVHMAELLTPPGRPNFLIGFLNRSGRAVPVVDLARLLNATATPIEMYTPLVIVQNNARRQMALLVDAVAGLDSVALESVPVPPEATVFNQCVTHMARNRSGESVYVLSLPQIMLAREREQMHAFARTAQARLDALPPETPAND